jgi:hypothetical protein
MRLATAYKRVNTLIWHDRLPEPGVLKFVDNETLPTDYGMTVHAVPFAKPIIVLNKRDKGYDKTLIHEMLHVAEPELNHGALFEILVRRYLRLARKNIRGLKKIHED